MKNFTKKIRHKSILVLLSLLPAIFLLSVSLTMSKYVMEKKVGNLTLNVTSVDVLLPGLQIRNALDDSVTKVVFGRTKDYESEIAGIESTNVDVKRTGKIKMYVKETTTYILSDRKIYANPDSYHMFYKREELTSVDFSNFDTGMVMTMRGMFRECKKLTEIKNITSWNTGNVETMEFLFKDCPSLVSLDLSGWNTAKVKNLYGTFYGCKKLTSLDVSSWNTAGINNMEYIFYNCSSLTSLDLSGWDTAGVTNMNSMFYNCSGLVSVYVGSGWNTDKVTSSGNMFLQCKNLSGGEGTSYDAAHTDKTYARIDGGAANPGYFTDIADKP